MNHDNIKLLFLIRTADYIEYIFFISEDKYQYTMASCITTHLTYVVFTLNKITQDWIYTADALFTSKELNDIIKESKNIKEYKCLVNHTDYRNNITRDSITHIRKLKIENILQ